jgi:hypothetical protein
MPKAKKPEERQATTDRTEKEPRWQCPGPIQDDIVYLATTTKWTPAQIYEEVTDDLARKKSKLIMTSKRTVERMVLFYRTRTLFELWSVADGEVEDAAPILEVLADVILSLERKHSFSKREAEWVLRIRRILPEVERFTAWEIARAYLIAETRGRDTSALDTYLAFNTWKNANRSGNYNYAQERGWIEGVTIELDYDDKELLEGVDKNASALRLQIEGMERTGPSKPEQAKRRHHIERQDPELAEKMLKAWEDGFQRQKQLWFEWRRQGKTKLTPKDKAAWLSVWDEYNRLADSYKEGQGNGEPIDRQAPSILTDYTKL